MELKKLIDHSFASKEEEIAYLKYTIIFLQNMLLKKDQEMVELKKKLDEDIMVKEFDSDGYFPNLYRVRPYEDVNLEALAECGVCSDYTGMSVYLKSINSYNNIRLCYYSGPYTHNEEFIFHELMDKLKFNFMKELQKEKDRIKQLKERLNGTT